MSTSLLIAIVIPLFLRNIDAVENFIDLGADVNLRCHGTPTLSLAIMMSSLPGAESFCKSAVAMILNCSCDLTAKVTLLLGFPIHRICDRYFTI